MKCKKMKSIGSFNKRASSADGLQSYCRMCNKKIGRERYKNIRDKRDSKEIEKASLRIERIKEEDDGP